MKSSKLFMLSLALFIAALGLISIYSSTYQAQGNAWQMVFRRQVLWLILGITAFLLVSGLNYRWLWDSTYAMYAAVLFLLLLVVLVGSVHSGAQRWLRLAWFNFQPSEFAKLVMIIFLARYFSRKSADNVALLSGRMGVFKALVLPFIFVAVLAMLIIDQPDLGSGLLVIFIFIAMLFVSRVKMKYFIIFCLALLAPAPLLWHILRDYQKDRLLVFLNPNIDPLGAGYTIIQARIAIGSGAFFGKGWLSGTQSQLHFLPESHTDFIFSTFAEEWGLFGCAILLLLYFLLIRQGFKIAEKTKDYFGRLLALGISLMLLIQVAINIAMNLGVAPVVGVPLPLMSYGGSSMITTFIALGILVSIEKRRAVF